MENTFIHAVPGPDRERDRRLALAVLLAAAAAAALVHPAAAVAVSVAALVFALRDWRLPSTTALGLFLAATVLVSANYRLAVGSPVDLTGHRLALAALVLAWLTGQLDVRSHWPDAAARVNRPLAWLFGISVATLLLNLATLAAQGEVASGIKRLAALAGYILAYSLTIALVRRRADAVRTVRFLVALGALAGVVAIVERLTGLNAAQKALDVLPFDKYQFTEQMTRAAGARVYGTGSHPIEFGAMMCLLLPLALYLAFAGRGVWRLVWAGAAGAIAVGMLFSVSRSALIGTAVALLVMLLVARPRQKLALGAVALGGAFAVSAAFPTVVATLQRMLDPKWIAAQEAVAYSGRMEDWPRVWAMVAANPLVGTGYDMFVAARYFHLDNQYLKFALELGVVGLVVAGWALFASLGVGVQALRRAPVSEGLPLEAALLATMSSFIVLGLLFDTFGFFQVTNVFFVVVGLAVVLASPEPEPLQGVTHAA